MTQTVACFDNIPSVLENFVYCFVRWSALKCQVKLVKSYISLLIKFISFLLFL